MTVDTFTISFVYMCVCVCVCMCVGVGVGVSYRCSLTLAKNVRCACFDDLCRLFRRLRS